MVVSLPAGTSSLTGQVPSPWNQPAGLASPTSLAAVVRRMKGAAHTNVTSEPTLDEIEVKYQQELALRCAAGLQFPSLTIVVISPVISHVMHASGLTQQTKVVDYQSADVTSIVASHFGSLNARGSTVYDGCSQSVLDQPSLAFQVGQGCVEASAVNVGHMKASDTEAEWAHTVMWRSRT